MDLLLSGKGCLDAIRVIRAANPTTHVLIMTGYVDDCYLMAAIQAGALGYLRKDSSPDDLLNAICLTAKGTPYLPEEFVQKLVRSLHDTPCKVQAGGHLTKRELDVLIAMAEGMTNQEVANHFVVGKTTVRRYVPTGMGKFYGKNQGKAALDALESGIMYRVALTA
jgi:DNA-binding NarL/FixJ family response regulator